jgi:hypothetical protein
MNILKSVLMTLPVLTLFLSGVAAAEECGAGAVKIDESTRKFSVVLQKLSGMEDQSFDDIGCAVLSRNGECATRQGMFDSNAVTYDHSTGEQVPDPPGHVRQQRRDLRSLHRGAGPR